jgi:formylglycine-generating enzyme required for sulfatase activity
MVRSALFVYLTLVFGVGLFHAREIGAQDIARLQSGVVKITAKPPSGTTSIGPGFIVRLESNAAYIVIAAHVVAGNPNPKVEFFSKQHVQFPVEVLPGAEGGDDVGGLALLLVRGKENLPSGIGALPLASTSLMLEDMVMIGFPLGAGPWHVTKGNIGSRQGRTIYFDPRVDSGNSGGPIIQKGKVVGVVMAARSSDQGITVRGVQDYIEGFGITAHESTSSASMATEPLPPPTATAKLEPRPMTQDREVTRKDGAPMVLIPAGEFWMGSPDGEGTKDEHPRHQVSLDAFNMDKFEVTVARYAEFVRSTNRLKPRYWDQVDSSKHGNLPVVGVNWDDAEAYCRWNGKRLPTEAEWEKAARGTDGRTYPWGNEGPTPRLANFGKDYTNVNNVYDERLARVDGDEAGKSPYGLHHMAGNVWEWTADWYDQQYYEKSPPQNPKGPSSDTGNKVLRGGSFDNEPDDVRAVFRDWSSPPVRHNHFGVRCAQDRQN